jgi:cyclic pyranopterin monophosphate synthase
VLPPMKMIDVGAKPRTERVAVARGRVAMAPATAARILAGTVEKGDVLAAARLAGIMAAKRTPDLVPLCHPIALSGVEVEIEVGEGGLEVRATVRTVDRTGVEMEALAAVAAACLTVYDMLKRYERGMRVEALELIEKRGGRSGLWRRAPAAPADPAAGRPPRSRRTPAGPRPPRARPAPGGRPPAGARAGRRR